MVKLDPKDASALQILLANLAQEGSLKATAYLDQVLEHKEIIETAIINHEEGWDPEVEAERYERAAELAGVYEPGMSDSVCHEDAGQWEESMGFDTPESLQAKANMRMN